MWESKTTKLEPYKMSLYEEKTGSGLVFEPICTFSKHSWKICFRITHGWDITERQLILNHSRSSDVEHALRLLTNVSRIGKKQHTGLTDARMARDFEDVKKIMQHIIHNNPFTTTYIYGKPFNTEGVSLYLLEY